MGLGVWTTVEGNVYPSATRYGGGFQWMVVDENRTSTNQSRLRIRPYIKKVKDIDNDYAAYNLSYQNSYFEINDTNRKTFSTRFDFRKASVGTVYALDTEALPFETDAENEYVEYTITHDNNGASTVKITGYIKGEKASNYFQYVKTTASVTLPRINRATTISVQDTPIGGVMKLYLNRSSADSEDYITAYVGNKSYSVSTGTQNTYIEWIVPDEVYTLIPAEKQIECRILCETYSGTTGAFLGSSSATVNLYVDKVPGFSVTATTDSTDGTLLIKGISTVTISVSNLKATTGAAAGFTFHISDGAKSSSSNPAYFEKAIKDTYTVTVTDGRGISTTKQIKIANVSPYIPPTIGSVDIARDIETGSAEISVRGKWTSGVIDGTNENEFVIIQVEVYEKGAEDMTGFERYFIDPTSTSGVATVEDFSATFTVGGLALDKVYTVYVYALDIFYNIDSPEYPVDFPAEPFGITIPRAVPVFQWKDGTFKINGNLEVTGTYPGGSGGSGGGSYTAGTGIEISDGVISVVTTNDAVQGDSRPVSSGALYDMLVQINNALGGI